MGPLQNCPRNEQFGLLRFVRCFDPGLPVIQLTPLCYIRSSDSLLPTHPIRKSWFMEEPTLADPTNYCVARRSCRIQSGFHGYRLVPL